MIIFVKTCLVVSICLLSVRLSFRWSLTHSVRTSPSLLYSDLFSMVKQRKNVPKFST